MPEMQVYKDEKLIGTEEFDDSFLVIKIDDELYWGDDRKLYSRGLGGQVE